MSKKVFVLFGLLVAFFASSVQAAPVIYAGKKTGTVFTSYAPNLQNILSEYQDFRGDNVPKVEKTLGCTDNIQKVLTTPDSVGFCQADIVAAWKKTAGADRNKIRIVGRLPVKECMFFITAKDSPIKDEDDIPGHRVAVGNPDSGSAGSWKLILDLVPEYKEAIPSNVDGKDVLTRLTDRGEDGYDGFFFVSAKDSVNQYVRAVNAEGSQLKFIDFDDYGLNNKDADGKQLYVFEKAKINADGDTVEVPCMDSVLIGNSENSEELVDAIADTMLYKSKAIVTQQK